MSIELRCTVIELNDININPNIENEGEWVLNEDLTFEYTCLVLIIQLIWKIS